MKTFRRISLLMLPYLALAFSACSAEKEVVESDDGSDVLTADLEANPSQTTYESTLEETDEVEDDSPAQSEPSPNSDGLDGFAIKAITAKGSGCPEDSVAINISEDQKAFTVTFGDFGIEVGPGVARSKKSCRLTLKLDVPKGWQYSVASFNHRGFIALDEGVEALHATRYFFKGKGKGGGFRHQEVGEIAKDFVYTDKVGILSAQLSHEWSDCVGKRNLQIDTAIQLKNSDPELFPDATGIFSNDSVDGEIRQVFGLNWRRCKKSQ